MIELLEKLISEDFADTFKPASEDDLSKRFDGMDEDEMHETLSDRMAEQSDNWLWQEAEEAGGDPVDYCVEQIMMGLIDVEDMKKMYLRLLSGDEH